MELLLIHGNIQLLMFVLLFDSFMEVGQSIFISNISFLHLENQQILLNSYASCRRLLDHMKQVAGIHPDGKSFAFSLSLDILLYRNRRCYGS